MSWARTTALLLLGVVGCVEGRLYAAPMVAGHDLTLELRSARAYVDRVEVVVTIRNDWRRPVVTDRGSWRLHTPDAALLLPDERGPVRIAAGVNLGLVFRHDRPALADAPGFWLVPGEVHNEQGGSLPLAPMALGHPTTPPPGAAR